MSGEAGANLEGELYSVSVGSGLIVSVALPPGDDGSAVGRYFDDHSAPFERWMAHAKPQLDALFAQLVAEGEPLVPVNQPHETLDGTFLESGKDAHFRKYHRGGPLAVFLDGHGLLPEGQTLRLKLVVARRVEKKRMDALLARVAQVLLAARPPPEPPEPDDHGFDALPPPPPPSRWARLFGRRKP
jgi:hypothetical protein